MLKIEGSLLSTDVAMDVSLNANHDSRDNVLSGGRNTVGGFVDALVITKGDTRWR